MLPVRSGATTSRISGSPSHNYQCTDLHTTEECSYRAVPKVPVFRVMWVGMDEDLQCSVRASEASIGLLG